MDKALLDYVKNHPRMPLPELKLELMKRGFSSYQIEQAIKKTKEKRNNFFVYLVFILVLAIILIIISLIFVSFIQPAEKLTKVGIESEDQEQKWIAVPSERPTAPEDDFFEEEIEEKEIIDAKPAEKQAIPAKTIEDIKKISDTNPTQALEQCNEVQNKDECISLVAKNTNNVELCTQITDSNTKDYCFYFFGQANNEYCENIVAFSTRNTCEMVSDFTFS
jgi:cytoskeletal protein RodZ